MKQFFSNIYALGFIVYCLIAGGLFFYISKSTDDINSQINHLITDFQTKRHAIAEMSEATKLRILLLVEMSGTNDFFEREALQTRFFEQGSRYLKAREQIQSVEFKAEENAEMQRIGEAVNIIAPEIRKVSHLLMEDESFDIALLQLQQVLPLQKNITESFEKLIASISDQVANRQLVLQSELIYHQQLIVLLFIVSIVLALVTLGLMLRNQAKLSRLTEQALTEKHRAEVANQEKSRFLANMSHELRTPMHAILNFTALALKRSDDSKQERFLQNIRTSGVRLTALLDNLLDLSKLEAEKMEADFVFQDMATLIKNAVSEMSSLAKDKAIQVKIDADKKLECMFDQKLMFQVIVNLLSNAVKFSPENSQIEIALTNVESQEGEADSNMIQVSVSDQGVGIPEDQLEMVFDKFYQSSTTRSQAGGTGLGLPICKEIIALHKGKIWVESSSKGSDAGSVFYFQIPIIHLTSEVIDIPDMQAAIDSHLAWKKMIETSIIGDADTVNLKLMSETNSHLCPLGRWIDSVEIDGSLLSELKRIHSKFHLLAGEIVALHEANQDSAKNEKLLEFQQVSEQIIRLLKSMQYHAETNRKAA